MLFEIIYSYLSSGSSHVKLKIVNLVLHGSAYFLEDADVGWYDFQLGTLKADWDSRTLLYVMCWWQTYNTAKLFHVNQTDLATCWVQHVKCCRILKNLLKSFDNRRERQVEWQELCIVFLYDVNSMCYRNIIACDSLKQKLDLLYQP